MNNEVVPMSKDLIDQIIATRNVPYKYTHINFIEDLSGSVIELRNLYTKHCSWCLVSHSWIKYLAKLLKEKKVIEIYAGLGLLSHILQEYYNIDIDCSDNKDWKDYYNNAPYTDVKDIDAVDAIKSYEDNTLDYVICSWPPYKEKRIEKVVETLKYHQKNCKLIYIGEDVYGYNATEEFFSLVDDVSFDKPYKSILNDMNEEFQSWYNIYDDIVLYKPRRRK